MSHTISGRIGPTKDKRSRETIHNLVYQEIRRSLMVGTFAPGEKVSVRSLAEQVGTSLTPVRGAVNRLIAEGAFEVLPNRWLLIPPMSQQKFKEITHWRIKLETEAIRRACGKISKELIDDITSLNHRISDLMYEGHNRRELLTLNYDFHFTIYRVANSKILLTMIESLWLQAGPFTYYSLLSPRDLWNASHHVAIIAALREGNANAAATALERDITTAADFLQENGHYKQRRLNRILA